MAGRFEPYSTAGLRADGRSRCKSIEPISAETSGQTLAARQLAASPPLRRPLILCPSPESGMGRTPTYCIERGGSGHHFRLIRRRSKDDPAALSIEHFDQKRRGVILRTATDEP